MDSSESLKPSKDGYDGALWKTKGYPCDRGFREEPLLEASLVVTSWKENQQ